MSDTVTVGDIDDVRLEGQQLLVAGWRPQVSWPKAEDSGETSGTRASLDILVKALHMADYAYAAPCLTGKREI